MPFSAQATYVDTREVAEASVNGAVYVVRNGRRARLVPHPDLESAWARPA